MNVSLPMVARALRFQEQEIHPSFRENFVLAEIPSAGSLVFPLSTSLLPE